MFYFQHFHNKFRQTRFLIIFIVLQNKLILSWNDEYFTYYLVSLKILMNLKLESRVASFSLIKVMISSLYWNKDIFCVILPVGRFNITFDIKLISQQINAIRQREHFDHSKSCRINNNNLKGKSYGLTIFHRSLFKIICIYLFPLSTETYFITQMEYPR